MDWILLIKWNGWGFCQVIWTEREVVGLDLRRIGKGESPRRLSENSILDDLAIVNSATYEAKKAE